jgi:NADH dehydrogenase
MTDLDAFPDVDRTPAPVDGKPHVVIVGAGFGGLACARKLGGADVRVTVVDRRNYHLFVPLLYQVATAALSPAEISSPVRSVLARHANIDSVMAEVSGVDLAARRLRLSDGGYLPYDILILATGSAYNYFGHDEWAAHAPGLKTIENARAIRADLLRAFEEAETCSDPERRQALLTTVIVGGGPTGVEMAGAIAELARYTLARDFRRIDPSSASVILIEAGGKVLSAFPDPLPAYALRRLEKMGVEVRLNTMVEAIEADSVMASGQRIPAANIIWGAGIRASAGAEWIGVKPDRIGRIPVNADLSVPGHPEVYALGDVAAFEQDGGPVPALAQVARQQGEHLGRELRRTLTRGGKVRPYRYETRGDTAVIGRHAAVYSYKRWKMTGPFAWLLWAIVHVFLLIGVDKRILVATEWVWRYLTYERGARLID